MLIGRLLLKEYWRRSPAKAITYRIVIIFLDITVIYLMTGRLDIALGFMIVSNVYTSVAYYFHEGIWNKISMGKDKIRANCNYTRLRLHMTNKKTSCKSPVEKPKTGECSPEQIAECHPKSKTHPCK